MKERTKLLSVLGLGLAVAIGLGGKDGKEAKAMIGEPAPQWTLKDTEGKEYSLADFKGKIVVLEWTNPQCPFIVGCYKAGVVGKTLEQIKEIDPNVVYFSVNSTAVGRSGPLDEEDVKKETADFLKDNKVEITALSDFDGTVGRLYGAKTTPHAFVIDVDGVLRYHGAYTDDPSSKNAEATNYVVNAVKQIAAGETVTPDHVKSWGCSVKYAAKGEASKKRSGEGDVKKRSGKSDEYSPE